MVTESEMHTADEFIQTVNVDRCVKVVENAHWLYLLRYFKSALQLPAGKRMNGPQLILAMVSTGSYMFKGNQWYSKWRKNGVRIYAASSLLSPFLILSNRVIAALKSSSASDSMPRCCSCNSSGRFLKCACVQG